MGDEQIISSLVGKDGTTVLVAINVDDPLAERPVGDKPMNLDQALQSLSAVASQAAEALETLKWQSMSIEFGVKFGVKSGSLLAVIGSLDATSSMTVKLDFVRPQPSL